MEFVIIPLLAVLYLTLGIFTLIRRGIGDGGMMEVVRVAGLWPLYIKAFWTKPPPPPPPIKGKPH
jgi:hypothetical protein